MIHPYMSNNIVMPIEASLKQEKNSTIILMLHLKNNIISSQRLKAIMILINMLQLMLLNLLTIELFKD